jgi:hypothetical protein
MKARVKIGTSIGDGTRIVLELPRKWQETEKIDADPSLAG